MKENTKLILLPLIILLSIFFIALVHQQKKLIKEKTEFIQLQDSILLNKITDLIKNIKLHDIESQSLQSRFEQIDLITSQYQSGANNEYNSGKIAYLKNDLTVLEESKNKSLPNQSSYDLLYNDLKGIYKKSLKTPFPLSPDTYERFLLLERIEVPSKDSIELTLIPFLSWRLDDESLKVVLNGQQIEPSEMPFHYDRHINSLYIEFLTKVTQEKQHARM